MRVILKDFQTQAAKQLLDSLQYMTESYYERNRPSAVCLQAPTGAGKTIVSAAVIEALFYGDDELGIDADEKAVVIWLSDSPNLNEQTKKRFIAASDKFADNPNDERCIETITNNFCASHEELEPRHIYFLSKDLLGSNGLLVKGSEENGGRVFWDVLDATIKDRDRHVFLFIDEAHRGLGANTSSLSAKKQNTIFGNIIDGVGGRSAMPMVVGVTATPERFNVAMQGRIGRATEPEVQITPLQVQESGLLKDMIELRVPIKDDPVEHQYLNMACKRYVEMCDAWDKYCSEQGIELVSPLLVVQTEDNISADALRDRCDQITHNIKGLDNKLSFAHVFGKHEDIDAGKYFIPYVNPEDVEDKPYIRVLFAKEAISNGWDCPRAEVIYSARRRSDATYIAQLVGRMVRTPLARRIDSNETLNSVACYLPRFNPEATEDVVDYLVGKKDDIGGTGGQAPIVNPVVVVPAKPKVQASKPRAEEPLAPVEEVAETSDIEDAVVEEQVDIAVETTSEITQSVDAEEYYEFDTDYEPVARDSSFTPGDWDAMKKAWDGLYFITREQNEEAGVFKRLTNIASWLVDSDLDRNAPADCRRIFVSSVNNAIEQYKTKYEEARYRAEYAESMAQYLNMLEAAKDPENREKIVRKKEETHEADLFGIKQIAKLASRYYGGDEYLNAYRKACYKAGDDEYETELKIAAIGGCDSILKSVRDWANKQGQNYLEKYHEKVVYLPEEMQQIYRELRTKSGLPQKRKVEWPHGEHRVSGDKKYPKHILQEEDGSCPIDANNLEQEVLDYELEQENTLAFYRNPQSGYKNEAFSIVWRDYENARSHHSMYPDFIFFRKMPDGSVRLSIVDPHGIQNSDSLSKLKGYVNYLREMPDVFLQVFSVAKIDGENRYLDLKDEATQDAIMNWSEDSLEPLYLGEHSFHYGD